MKLPNRNEQAVPSAAPNKFAVLRLRNYISRLWFAYSHRQCRMPILRQQRQLKFLTMNFWPVKRHDTRDFSNLGGKKSCAEGKTYNLDNIWLDPWNNYSRSSHSISPKSTQDLLIGSIGERGGWRVSMMGVLVIWRIAVNGRNRGEELSQALPLVGRKGGGGGQVDNGDSFKGSVQKGLQSISEGIRQIKNVEDLFTSRSKGGRTVNWMRKTNALRLSPCPPSQKNTYA